MKPSFPTIRRRLWVSGVVQGVGFRPFVYGLATRLGVTGMVGNDSRGVFIEIEGTPGTVATFAADLVRNPPPLAHIEAVSATDLPVQGDRNFVIAESTRAAGEHTLIAPDLSICADCLCELFDPTNRRYRYPFINCTHCGPRFTITRDIPYDRPLTTMAGFVMCPACQAEYDDPRDRRFHAQPNACPTCGPQLEFRWSTGGDPQVAQIGPDLPTSGQGDALAAAQQVLQAGGIVAVKGIGGFHLACDPTNDQAVQRLRQRKGRVDKPFALMVGDVAAARLLAEVNPAEEQLLTSRERPIVLLRQRPDTPLSPHLAPGNPYIGVMLPYSPLHYLLTSYAPLGRLVMTSGNDSAEPIVKDNEAALAQLSGLADAFLLHNRPIHVRCDDAVVRVFAGQELPIRRSRGYAPFPVKLPFRAAPILAVGGELKSTFCVTNGDHAFLSQHIGDLENLETLEALQESVAHFQTIFRVQPTVIASDLHPGYLSSKWAQQQAQARNLRHIQVQHHHAHIAALMAEQGLAGTTPVIGFSFDGTGYGTDGAIWGGEVLVADYYHFRRAAHLRYVPLPGGDAAIKHPYRLALAQLWAAGVDWHTDLPAVATATQIERNVLRRQFTTGFQTIPTSSMGRLFDAVAALIGLRQTVTYEGQAAIELEANCELRIARPKGTRELRVESLGYTFAIAGDDPLQFDAAPLIRAISADVLAGVDGAIIAERFHRAVADLICQVSLRLRQQMGLNQVALSGGVFQNTHLLALAIERLQAERFEVLWHRLVPPNDGGLALGQAMIAHAQGAGSA